MRVRTVDGRPQPHADEDFVGTDVFADELAVAMLRPNEQVVRSTLLSSGNKATREQLGH